MNPSKGKLTLYWKNPEGELYRSLGALKKGLQIQKKELSFAMNGGMYMEDRKPLGLFIEDGITKRNLSTRQNGYGNFYLQPNGVFYLKKDHSAGVIKSPSFQKTSDIAFATQSGPMLLIDGKYHPKFVKGSSNLNVRNGVGILPNGELLFIMSKKRVNFYDFATIFKQKGCNNALYLDGFVSRTYLPSKGSNQLGGNFGVIIGEVK